LLLVLWSAMRTGLWDGGPGEASGVPGFGAAGDAVLALAGVAVGLPAVRGSSNTVHPGQFPQ